MSNPLLQTQVLPPFEQIEAEHVVPAVTELTNRNRQRIAQLVKEVEEPTWENFIAPLEDWADELQQAWSPVGHLSYVKDSPELREAYKESIQLLSAYHTELGQNRGLFEGYTKIRNSDAFKQLSQAQQQTIENALIDFSLTGIGLPEAEQKEFAELASQLAELSNRFQENVLDATQGWTLLIEDEARLAGLPETAKGTLAQNAKLKEQTGWLINLEFPSYLPVMTYCDDGDIRKQVYLAQITRASEVGPNAGQWDNTETIRHLLEGRLKKAKLLNYDNFAQVSLAKKMAEDEGQVLAFLDELASKSYPQAQREFSELAAFAQEHLGLSELQPWDVTYVAEKLKLHQYSVSQEELRPYFPVDQVMKGLFETASRLFGVSFQQATDFESYHPDVRYYQVMKDGDPVASFYLDMYAREGKKGGAWMDDCRIRRRTEAGLQLPVAYLVCNFTAPLGDDQPSLLTHNEVTTLFHEFGHGLHHMLTQVEVSEVSGINGVAWDAVELPSQFMENYCWQPEALAFISGHYESGEPLPKELLDKMLAAKNFGSAMQMVRQLEFALFDFRLHAEFDPGEAKQVASIMDQVRQQVSVVPVVPDNRFQNAFSHIFAGGYAAGYYSYKWAEVLSADAFSLFEEKGIFDPATGTSFRDNILAKGGSEPAMNLFKAFRGREPEVEPLLRHSGIS